MASGNSSSISSRYGSFGSSIRFRYSTSYNPYTNESTVTFVPQLYSDTNPGAPIQMHNYRTNYGYMSDAGVYADGTKIWSFSGGWNGEQHLNTSGADWNDMTANTDAVFQFTKKHDSSGYLSFTLGVIGQVQGSYAGSPYSVYTDPSVTSTITIHEDPQLWVEFQGNGGTGAPDTQYFYSGVPFTLSSVAPTMAGHHFLHWYSDGDLFYPGQTVTFYGNSRLWAVYAPNSYTVTCQDRVGSSSGTLLGTKTASYTYGSSVSGASFGSDTSYDAYYTGYHYTGSSSTITVDGDETVYRYFALNTWTVSYNANGGSGAPSSQTKTYGINLTLSATVPARTGYDFLGWSKSNTATTATYSAGSTYTANEGAILYAVWKIKTYTISYDATGGSGAPSPQTKTYDVNLTLSSSAPTLTGCVFLGWSTSLPAASVTYSPGGIYTANASATLYAVWGWETYAVFYNANGHGTAPSSQTKTYGVALTLSSFISNQTGTGARVDYTITGNANGGTWSGSNGFASRTPQYTYSQNEWNTMPDGTGTGYASGASYTENAATTLYAIWNTSTSYTYTYALPSDTPAKNQTVTVTFNANGGSTTKISQTSTRAMTFAGWYTSASGGTKRTAASQVSASETVYAHYGDGTSAYPSVTLPTASQCARTGYTLLGFATSPTATSATYSPGESYTPTAGITLYAVWRIISYSVSASISARGITANILRTASPVAGAASGLLSNGDTIYYNDTVKVSWAISTGYQADMLRINGEDASSFSEKTVTVASALTVILTVKLGAIVYINGVAYQAFIDNGSDFSAQYEAYIDNGSSWEAY